jgi:Ca2+-binding RTX toxin-like protein
MKSQLTSLGNGLLSGTIKRHLTSLGGGLLLLAAFGSIACDETDEPEAQDNQNTGENELGVNFDALGANVTTCTAADTQNDVYVASTKTLNLTLGATDDAIVSVVGGKLKVNGYLCKTAAIQADPNATPPVAAAAAIDLTSTNVNKLNITAASTNKVVIDLLPGTFGNIFGAAGGIIIAGDDVAVGVRGSATANVVKMGEEDGADAFYFELSGDAKPDLKIDGDPGTITLALGDGADSFTAQGQTLTTTSLEGSAPTIDVTSATVVVYGGAGNDTLKGGTGDDTLDGGDGNDVFQTSAGSVDDGADVYIGGSNIDTVDYSGRTDSVSVSVNPNNTVPWTKGGSLFNLSVTSGETLLYSTGTGGGATEARTLTFAAPTKTTPGAILDAINANATFTALATASLNDRGELVVAAKSNTDSIQLTGGTADIITDQTRVGERTTANADADDGFDGEGDDVRADVENITGGAGDDILTGGVGHDTIIGGAGNDSISGGLPASSCANDVDVLNGGEGDDVFVMGLNTNCGDAVDGGNGIDVVDYQMRSAGVTIVVDTVANDGESGEADKVVAEVMLGGEGNDTMTGGIGNDDFHGSIGNDILTGGAGNDTLVGGPGNDSLLGGAGDDYFNEKDKADQYRESDGTLVNAFIKGHFGSVVGSAQPDVINGGADFDTCDYARTATTDMIVTLCSNTTASTATVGNCAVATPSNAANNDTPDTDDITNCDDFVGGAGDDSITGSDASDMLSGGDGADSILGGAGDDELSGGNGNDTLNGGSGDGDICGVETFVSQCEI